MEAALDLCRAYSATVEDFEKILAVENTIFPFLINNSTGNKEEPLEGQ